MCASGGFRIPIDARSAGARLLAACLLICGCAPQQGIVLPDLSAWDVRQNYLSTVSHWEFSGRLGVKARDDGFNGRLRWRQEGTAFAATVGGPLGIGTVRIEGGPEAVTLTDKDGKLTLLGDVEADLRSRYGWTIPVNSLRYWALGIPDPDLPGATEFDAAGRLASLEQGDWIVMITHYREAAGQPMPFRLTAISADTRVRIVIDGWSFHD